MTWREPQAPYSCFITRFNHKRTNLILTISNISNCLKQLDEIVRSYFIPAISSGINCSDIEGKLLPLPPKLERLRIQIFS